MSAARRLLGTTAVAAAAALVLASCMAGEETDPPTAGAAASASGSAAPSATPSPTVPADSSPSAAPRTLPAEAQPPRNGACYLLDFEEATAPTNEERPVGCGKRHTARTYHVGHLDTVVDGHLLAVDSALAQEQVQTACTRRFRAYVGGSPRDRRLSRLKPVWFSPTIDQSDLGASWFRCDVVALARGSALAGLPRRVRGILDRPGALDRVGICGTTAPGERGFERVICGRRHTWKALTTIDIPGQDRYPGVATVRRAGEGRCREVVRRASGSPTRFRYGWEWPTREQWRAGQRYGYCWAPD